MFEAKKSWKWNEKKNITWREAKFLVKMNGKGYGLGHEYIYEIDFNDEFYHKRISNEDWSQARCVVTYKGHMYGFFAKGIRKTNSASKTSTNVSSDDWSQVLFKCAVNFENHCYLHSANAIWYVNLSNGSFRKIDTNKWEGSTALIPVPNNEIGFKSRS